jgi:hypothetical protein
MILGTNEIRNEYDNDNTATCITYLTVLRLHLVSSMHKCAAEHVVLIFTLMCILTQVVKISVISAHQRLKPFFLTQCGVQPRFHLQQLGSNLSSLSSSHLALSIFCLQ